MTDKELKILEILKASVDALSANEIATRIYGANSPSELVTSKLQRLEALGYIERFYIKKSYKFLITENGEKIEQIKTNENEQLMFEFVEDGNKSVGKSAVAVENKTEKVVYSKEESDIANKVLKDTISKNCNISLNEQEKIKIELERQIKAKDLRTADRNNNKVLFAKKGKKDNEIENIIVENNTQDDDIIDIKNIDQSEIFDKERQLKEQFNKAWSEILKDEKDYYGLMDERSFSLLKSALNNINSISTFRTTVAFIKRLENVFDISSEEIAAVEKDARALKVNDSSFDVEHLGKINIIAEIKCNVSTNGSNRFGAGQTSALKKDIDCLINGKPRSKVQNISECYKFMVIYKNDEIIDDAVQNLVETLPNDLSKYLLVYRDGMVMSKEYVYIYVM